MQASKSMRTSTPYNYKHIYTKMFSRGCIPTKIFSFEVYDSYKAASKFYAKYDATMYSQKSKPYDFISLVLRLHKFPNQYSTKVTCGY